MAVESQGHIEPVNAAEAPGLVPGPGSATWRHALDWRLLLGAGRALVLQVAHPVIGAGVAEHSDFQADPWGRLDRTLTSLMTQVYGGAQSRAEADRLREMHKDIKGVDARGRRYHALNPEAYAWVHLSNFDSALAVYEYFGTPPAPAQRAALYEEWRQLALVLGLRSHQLPADLHAFREYMDDKVANRLEDNPTVHEVLDSLSGKGLVPPPWWPGPEFSWAPLRPVSGKVLTTATVGTLPPRLRERFGLGWSATDERWLRLVGSAARAVLPRLPARLRFHPIAYRALRASGSLTSGRRASGSPDSGRRGSGSQASGRH